MPRPRKNGLDYFPLDVDFLDDPKIKILKARYGRDGIVFYIYLLCEIYKQGYYLQIDEDFEYIISDDLKIDQNKAKQEFVDSECLRYMNKLTPRRTGMMIKSATLGTVIGSGSIEYLAPYARRQYYEHKTKRLWFETMKKGHGDKIRKGAAKFIAG